MVGQAPSEINMKGSLKQFLDSRDGVKKWRAQWRENGKGKTKILGHCSKMKRAEAEQLLAAIIAPMQEHSRSARRHGLTLGEFLDAYLALKRRVWKESTRETTEQIIEDHLRKTPLGERLLVTIAAEDLQSLLDEKAPGLSKSVVNHLRFQLNAIFRLAMGRGLVTINPTLGLMTPRSCKAPHEKRVMSDKELQQALWALEIRDRLVVRLASCEGLRPGEIVGLRISDLVSDGVRIERRFYRRVLDTPKSARGVRVVPLTPTTRRIMDEYTGILQRQEPDAWLFPSENDKTAIDPANVYRRRIRPALTNLGLGWVNYQVMRRTASTNMKLAGVDPKTRADLLGHNVDVNENVYTQTPLKERQKAMEKLDKHLQ
jgi:integrase